MSPVLPVEATVLGFDVGARRIGVAIGSGVGGRARALAVVDVHESRVDWAAVERLQREWRAQGFVVGDPVALDGDMADAGGQPSRRRAHAFARDLRQRFGLPVLLVDERMSSIEAAGRFAEARSEGRRRKRDADLLDAEAAAVIVERWLQAPADAVPLG